MSNTTPLPPLPPAPPLPPNPPPAPDPDAALRKQKLELEIRQLERATSSKAWTLEIVKAWASPLALIVTVFALIWTINIGIQQMRQTQNGQDQDRFDKAISRLGSSSVSERLTGAAGLSLFLTTSQENRHAATLRFLGTALAIEKDPNVRQAILDSFSHLDPGIVNQDAREDGLRTLLDLNRSALKAFLRQQESPGSSKFAKSPEADLQSQVDSLRASAHAIVILIKKHATQHDFSGIDCTDCDFSSDAGALDLTGSNFDHAVLTKANFAGANLAGSSFNGTFLAGTDFEGANLRGTHFIGTPHDSYAVQEFQRSGDKPEPPDLACADASAADFRGSLFFGVIESETSNERVAGYPDLFQTNLSGANLSQMGVHALSLTRAKSAAPFANTKIITYQAQMVKPRYGAMHIVESPDWRFVSSSPSYQRSWRYLQGQLQFASGLENALLPAPLSLYRGVPLPTMDDYAQHRCDKYKQFYGQ